MRNERFERFGKNEQRLYSLLNTIEIIDKLKGGSHRSRNTISSSFYALDVIIYTSPHAQNNLYDLK